MSEHEFEAYLNLLARTLKLSKEQRQRIAGELQQLAQHFAFKTQRGESHFIQVQTGIATAHDDDEASLIERANRNLARTLSAHQAA